MAAETFWERVDRLRRLRRLTLRAVGEAVGRTESWASRAVRSKYAHDVELSDRDLTRLADLLGVSRSELLPGSSGIVPLAALDGGPRLPVVSAVDAGEAHDHGYQGEYITVGAALFGDLGGAGAVYRVVGDCLRDRLIASGDYLVIDTRVTEPRDGEVVVARVNGVETAKLFYRVGDVVELRPASLGYEAIIVRASDELEIVGVYVGVIRAPGGR